VPFRHVVHPHTGGFLNYSGETTQDGPPRGYPNSLGSMAARRAVETSIYVGIVIFGLPDSGLTTGETTQVGSVLRVWTKGAILIVNLMIAAILLRVIIYVVSLHSVNAIQF